MTKYIIAILLALSGLLGWGFYHQTLAVSVLGEQNKSLTEAAEQAARRAKHTRQVLVARQAKLASQARILAQTESALSEALQRNKAWSDTHVPDDIQKALQGDPGGM